MPGTDLFTQCGQSKSSAIDRQTTSTRESYKAGNNMRHEEPNFVACGESMGHSFDVDKLPMGSVVFHREKSDHDLGHVGTIAEKNGHPRNDSSYPYHHKSEVNMDAREVRHDHECAKIERQGAIKSSHLSKEEVKNLNGKTSVSGSPFELIQAQTENVETQMRRSTKERRMPAKFSDYELFFAEEAEPSILISEFSEPTTYKAALKDVNSEKWQAAMREEMDSLLKNRTWDLVSLPPNRRPLRNKWVYKLKEEAEGNKRFKARLVVKGFDQERGIDFNEIFSLLVKMTTIRTVLGLAAAWDLELELLDVKTAFLHGDVEEELYMEQPQGFVKKGHEHLYCILNRSLYGLKQAPKQWYVKFDHFMTEHNFTRCESDPCIYFKKLPSGEFIILLLYVDDMLVAGTNKRIVNELKQKLASKFAMKDLGAAKKILGMTITRDKKKREITLSQKQYIDKVVERFGMADAKVTPIPLADHFRLSSELCPKTQEEKEFMEKIPYKSAIGSIMYAMVSTRPDIAHAVGVVSRFMSDPGKAHWEAVKWILRYLKGTSDYVLCFGGNKVQLQGYTNSDLARDLDKRRSTTSYTFTFVGAAISWAPRLQHCIALSSAQAEYLALSEGAREMIWLQRLLGDLKVHQSEYNLFCDSRSAIFIAHNHSSQRRSKHVDAHAHFVRLQLTRAS